MNSEEKNCQQILTISIKINYIEINHSTKQGLRCYSDNVCVPQVSHD